ncbi:MAG TPA: recombinase family protein, partial [Allocoleopsis sp.]
MNFSHSRQRYFSKQIKDVPASDVRIGYARVSSLEQANNTNALEQQIKRLEDAGATLIIADIQSGKRDDRPGLRETMRLVEYEKPAEVIVTRVDRLGRTVLTLRKNIDIFVKTGVKLQPLDKHIDLTTPQGMFMLNLLAGLAEMEVDQLSERVRHGKEYRRKRQAACECIPFGYTVSELHYRLDHSKFLCLLEQRPDHYLDLYEVDDIDQLPGLTVARIARDCVTTFLEVKGSRPAIKLLVEKYGIGRCHAKKNGNDKILHWIPSGLRRWLNNPVLCGHTVYNKRIKTTDGRRKDIAPQDWRVVENTHPDDRLISDEEL